MSDVILYAALKENVKLQQELLEFCTGGAGGGISFYTSGDGQGGYPYTEASADGGAADFSTCPPIVADWVTNLCPVLNTELTCGFKVCGNCWRCGTNCTWCVPPGVCCVQFQMWGPGGGTSANCCCGGSPHGPSGAYMLVQMPVTPGECYCLCAGCAYCCFARQETPGICGSPTWISQSGNGFCACVDSGISCYNHWASDIQAAGHGQGSTCGVPHFDGCAPSSCSGYNFCWDSGNDNTEICHAFASRTSFRVVSTPSDSREVVSYGINGMWPAIKIGGDLHSQSCSISTPIFGFESCVCADQYCGGDSDEINGGCFRSADRGYLRIPSVGGYRDYTCDGGGACGGDSGRFGMVCVSYTCS